MPNPPRKWRQRLGRAVFALSILLCLLLTFGLISGTDEAAFRQFDAASHRWQINPEFRSVATEYTVRGSEAMRADVLFFSARQVILAMRSLPWLPKELAASPTSWQHYQDFSQGSLSAYLHLCSEQDVKDMAGIFAAAGHKTPPDDADLRNVLGAYHMDFPVITDAGVRQSVADMLRDTDAGRGFSFAQDITPRLIDPIRQIAGQLQIPTDPTQMTPPQQQIIFERLDGYIRASDPELWRTKQVNDFSIGVWAQVYGPEYKSAIRPILMSHDGGIIGLVVLLGFTMVRSLRRTKSDVDTAEKLVGAGYSES